MVERGLGVSLLPAWAVRDEVAWGWLSKLRIEGHRLRRTVAVISLARFQPAATRAFLEFVRERRGGAAADGRRPRARRRAQAGSAASIRRGSETRICRFQPVGFRRPQRSHRFSGQAWPALASATIARESPRLRRSGLAWHGPYRWRVPGFRATRIGHGACHSPGCARPSLRVVTVTGASPGCRRTRGHDPGSVERSSVSPVPWGGGGDGRPRGPAGTLQSRVQRPGERGTTRMARRHEASPQVTGPWRAAGGAE